jgi:hypothetical protein
LAVAAIGCNESPASLDDGVAATEDVVETIRSEDASETDALDTTGADTIPAPPDVPATDAAIETTPPLSSDPVAPSPPSAPVFQTPTLTGPFFVFDDVPTRPILHAVGGLLDGQPVVALDDAHARMVIVSVPPTGTTPLVEVNSRRGIGWSGVEPAPAAASG